jgi:parallel beta-helix repeat protein
MKAILVLIVIAMLIGTSYLQTVGANAFPPPNLPELVISEDGSIQPQTDLINHEGNNYFLTANMTAKYRINIYCSNVVFDGKGYTIDGGEGLPAYGNLNPPCFALYIPHVSNITVRNITIQGFANAISLIYCNNSRISNVTISNNTRGIWVWNSLFNQIAGCNIVNNGWGIQIASDSGNNIVTNTSLQLNRYSLTISNSQNNLFTNIIVVNSQTALMLEHVLQNTNAPRTLPTNNTFFQNDFMNNAIVFEENKENVTFPKGNTEFQNITLTNNFSINGIGNYWGDYFAKYPNASEIDSTGVGDTPYILAPDNADEHPLVKPVSITTELSLTPTPTAGFSSNSGFLSITKSTIAIVTVAVVGIAIISLLIYRKQHPKS